MGLRLEIDLSTSSSGKTAVVAHLADRGGEARYGCRPDNLASIATARSVGFVPYSTSLVLSVPRPNL